MKTILISLLLTSLIYSQKVYDVPFASRGNEIELTVENKSILELKDVKVTATELPSWIKFNEEKQIIKTLKGKEKAVTTFKFEIEKEAPVNEETKLKFEITNAEGENWTKEIMIKVGAPKKFELNQNYPNPFNPTTIIGYTIPSEKTLHATSQQVQLKVYDILGREVATLVNGEQKPGYYKVEWNAKNYASGMYIYQLLLNGNTSEAKALRKKMLLLR